MSWWETWIVLFVFSIAVVTGIAVGIKIGSSSWPARSEVVAP